MPARISDAGRPLSSAVMFFSREKVKGTNRDLGLIDKDNNPDEIEKDNYK